MLTTPRLVSLLALTLGCQGTVTGDVSPQTDAAPEPDAWQEPALVCAHFDAALESVTPSVFLLVDRSWSMTWDFGDTSRWQAVRDTLMDASTGLVPRLADEVRFGAAFYTSDVAAGTCPLMTSIAPALGNTAAIAELYDTMSPLGHTPTGESLDQALAVIEDTPAPGPKVIVLATDGLPDTCTTPHPNSTPEALAAALGAAERAHDAGVVVMIVSVGDDVTADHLQEMANAGAGLPDDAEEQAPYYVGLEPEGLTAAFEDIINGVRHCTFTIDIGNTPDDPDDEGMRIDGGTVTLDGRELEQGSDWRVHGANTLEILGEACEELQSGDHQLEAELTCTARVM